jgi:hypothetical protein
MVKRARRSALMLPTLAGCAPPRATGGEELAGQLAGRTAGEPRRCVSAAGGQGLSIIAPGAVGYRVGETLWVSRLGPACSGIRPIDTLILEAGGGRPCRGDPVRAVAMGSRIAGPICILGDFVPYRRAG